MNKHKITGIVTYNTVQENGDVFLPGCFDNSIEKLKQSGVKILESHSTDKLILSFDCCEASIMRNGDIGLRFDNMKFK